MIGIPVHFATTSAISSVVTSSFIKEVSFSFSAKLVSKSTNFSFASFIFPYLNSATLPKSPSLSAISASCLKASISVLIFCMPSTISFSLFHLAWKEFRSSFIFARSVRNTFNLASSFSLLIASISISNCIILRSRTSNSSGFELISILIFAAASSIKSIALSGKKRLVIYL